MEVCQFCEMYMKPFITKEEATCEFCGMVIAHMHKGSWRKTVKITASRPITS